MRTHRGYREARLPLRRGLAALFAAATLLATSACNGDSTPPTAAPASATPTAAPTSTPNPTSPADGALIVTFRVAGSEEYRVRLTDPADIAIAGRLLAGEEAPRIPVASSGATPPSTPGTPGTSTPTTSSLPT